MSPTWLALWLPRLPTDRLRRAGAAPQDGRPVALYGKRGSAFVLSAVDAQAEAIGLKPGMALADAQAIRPDLATQAADPDADGLLLDRIAAWCDRFTPVVVPDPPHGLFLDLAGCAHLFGGPAAVLTEAKQLLEAQGFAVRAAVAPTPGAAWALARHGAVAVVEEDGLAAALARLPVAALRLAPEADALLRRLGLKTIGQIMDSPRQPFAARAGRHALLRLDQALGRVREALEPRRPPPSLFAVRSMAEPLLALDAVLTVTERLCAELAAQLAERGAGVRRLRLSLFGVDGRRRAIGIGLSRPEPDPEPMLRLLRERLAAAPETLDAQFGFEILRLDAMEVAPLLLHASDLDAAPTRDPGAEARLVDTLAARLGAERVGRLALRPVHAPERASAWTTADKPSAGPAAPADGVMRRPLRLFARAQPVEAIATVPDGPPVRFRWRRVGHELVRVEGPERIAPDWLRAPGGRARDYWRVEDRDGRRFWLYRETGDDAGPRWFLHGLFA